MNKPTGRRKPTKSDVVCRAAVMLWPTMRDQEVYNEPQDAVDSAERLADALIEAGFAVDDE